MLAQVEISRMTLLLLIHRLRFPFGANNDRAGLLSRDILEQFDSVMSLTKRSVQFMELSFVVACFEITDQSGREKALRDVSSIAEHSSLFQEMFRTLLTAFWAVADRHDGVYLYNLGAYLSPLLR